MKRFSLKLKLTAMYSFFMVLVTCLCLAVLFSLSGNEILTSAQMHLRERVQESADEIELEDGEFEIDSDFYSLDNNVYLALYDTGGNFLYGKVPPGLEQAPQFEDGKIQTVKSGTEQWYVYDVQYEMENGQEFYIDKNFPLHPTLLPQNNLPESDQRILCTSIHKIHMDTKMAEAMPHNYCTLPFVCT